MIDLQLSDETLHIVPNASDRVRGSDMESTPVTGYFEISDFMGGWTYPSVQPTRTAADDPTYTARFASVNYSAFLTEGTPVKWTQNGIVRYGFVSSAPVFSTNTTVTILTRCDGSSANYDMLDTSTYPITSFAYAKPKNPGIGFPVLDSYWSVTLTNTSDYTSVTNTNVYQQLNAALQIIAPIGAWLASYSVNANSTKAAGGVLQPLVALSTATGSASDLGMVRGIGIGTITVVANITLLTDYFLSLVAKTTYYIIMKNNVTVVDSINIYGSGSATKAILKSAYI